jgi:cytochrome c peroxidase
MLGYSVVNQRSSRMLPRCALLLASALLTACGGGGGSGGSTDPPASGASAAPTLSAAAQLGQLIFSDATLSASGQQSCATCHVSQFAFTEDSTSSGPDHGLPVPLGGPDVNLPGFRNTPSLKYLFYTPSFYYDSSGNPYGGFFRDGRAFNLIDQAVLPFTTSFEMANADADAVLARLVTRPYLPQFEALYGTAVLSDSTTTLQRMGAALAAFETENPDFRPFTSKYDYWQQGQVQLTAQELNGLELFNDPTKGNCAACHPSTSADGVTPALFTDFSYDNLGVPRNYAIAANTPATAPSYTPQNSTDGIQSYYDLGICGPFRDNAGRDLFGQCGQFKVPSLRNVALTAPYFHNGEFSSLVNAIGFYVRRDTHPEQWYPTATDGTVTKFDDLPALYGGQFLVQAGVVGSDAGYIGNVNVLEIPYNRHIGDTPSLSPSEINDVIVFLCTLTDGYDPSNPAALVLPPQCLTAVTP